VHSFSHENSRFISAISRDTKSGYFTTVMIFYRGQSHSIPPATNNFWRVNWEWERKKEPTASTVLKASLFAAQIVIIERVHYSGRFCHRVSAFLDRNPFFLSRYTLSSIKYNTHTHNTYFYLTHHRHAKIFSACRMPYSACWPQRTLSFWPCAQFRSCYKYN